MFLMHSLVCVQPDTLPHSKAQSYAGKCSLLHSAHVTMCLQIIPGTQRMCGMKLCCTDGQAAKNRGVLLLAGNLGVSAPSQLRRPEEVVYDGAGWLVAGGIACSFQHPAVLLGMRPTYQARVSARVAGPPSPVVHPSLRTCYHGEALCLAVLLRMASQPW
jgi:hypothetical protein